jgi:hypothetical protein
VTKRNLKRSPGVSVISLPDPKTDVTELVRDPHGQLVKIGTVVKREGYVHPLYGPMKKIHGQVVRIYTLPGNERIFVDVIEKKTRNIKPVHLDTLSRSSSKAFKGRKRA